MIRLNRDRSRKSLTSFSGAQPSWPYPDETRRVLGELETSAGKVEEMEYAAGLCLSRHAHDTAHLIYTIAGEHWSGFNRWSDDTCAPRTVRYLPPGEPHENYFPVGSRCLHVELHQPFLELVAEHGRRVHSAGELPKPSSVALGARLHREFQQRDDLSRLEIETVVLQLLLTDGADATRRRGLIPPWLLRIREMLREEQHLRLTLTELSRCVGRHPVQISRQFHQHFRCTITDYTRRVRIARAQALLLRRDLQVSEIALACGFFDQSHFTTAFRRLTGMPPHRYRLHISGKRPAQN